MEPSKKQETVVVQDYPQKMGYVQAQPHTHFRLKHTSDRQKLLHTIESASSIGPIVASYDYGRKYDTDIIIRKKGDSNSTKPIGKIHLLLFDRVKQAVTEFFQDLPPTSESYLGNSTRRNSKPKNSTRKHNPIPKFDTVSES